MSNDREPDDLVTDAFASEARSVVVMGVAGCGKSTIGSLLATELSLPFVEADEFHPPANVAKMAKGEPLTDADRDPWLAALADRITEAGPVVMSCSALKQRYRDRLRAGDSQAWFLHLMLTPEQATARVAGRGKAHFMPTSLVESQFATLEPLGSAESGLSVDASQAPEAIVVAALAAFRVRA